MKKQLLSIIVLLTFLISGFEMAAQSAVRDGAMEIRFRFDQFWANCGTGEAGDEDFVTNIRTRDYPDVDAASWTFSGPVAWTGPFGVCIPCCTYTNTANITRIYTYGARNTLGPQPTPQGIQVGFETWEDDCFSCAGGTICFSSCSDPHSRTVYESSCPCSCDCLFTGGDDEYANREQSGSAFTRFRDAVPNAFTFKGVLNGSSGGFTGPSAGGISYGATYNTFWTPPCPDTFWSDRPIICDPGYVTLQSGGAVFGGTYRWYRENPLGGPPIFIQETADSFFTLYVDRTTTYRVYTKNPVAPSAPAGTQTESWSYRALTIFLDKPVLTGITSRNPLCADSLNGQIVINATTSIPPLEYSINNGSTWSTSNTFNGLGEGIYLIKVRNRFCEIPSVGLPVQLIDPTPLSTVIGRVDSVSCNGLRDGSIELSVNGGTGPYTYRWSNGALTEDIYGVGAANYGVTVTDRNGCTSVNNTTVYQPTTLNATITGDSVSCAGAFDGRASVTVSGGTAPYTYLWSNGATTASITGLRGGLYTCVVRDRRGCEAVLSVNIFEAAPLQLRLSKTDLTCYGSNDGVVSVDTSALGGVPPYTYAWSPAGPNSPVRTGLAAGTYSVTLSDSRGCTATGSTVVNQPDSFRVSALVFDVRCSGRFNGQINLTVGGSTPPYTFNWTGPSGFTSTSEDIDSLRGGVYNVIVSDSRLCTYSASYAVNEPAPLNTVMTSTNNRCFGESFGTASVTISGGTAPYNILWSTFSTTPTINLLEAGDYTVVITDDNGCVKTDRVTVSEPSEIIITNVTIQNCICNGDSTGGVSFAAGGGSGTLRYVWSTGLVGTPNLTNVPAGTYTVFVSDDSGCSVSRNFVIEEPAPFITEVTGNNPNCSDNRTGFAVISCTGGTLPYNFRWNTTPSQTGLMAINLGGGLYVVTVTDLRGCTVSDSVTITPPLPIVVNTVPFAVKCFGGNDGRVLVNASGGNPPYRYYLNGVLQSDSLFTGLSAGTYKIEIQDVTSCVGSAVFVISEPTDFAVDLTANPRVIPRGMQAQLQATISSPLPVLRINWYSDPTGIDSIDFSPCADPTNCTNPIVRPSISTLYTVEVQNSDTCSVFDTVRVVVLQDRVAYIPTAFSPNSDGKNDKFDFQILGAKSVDVTIYNRYGELLYNNPSQMNGANQGWDGSFKNTQVPMDSYVYQFVVTYYDGEKETLSGTVTVLR